MPKSKGHSLKKCCHQLEYSTFLLPIIELIKTFLKARALIRDDFVNPLRKKTRVQVELLHPRFI